jgi:membrane protease YdiL (CAAX protease family)
LLLGTLPPIETRLRRILRLSGFEKGVTKLRELPIWSLALAIALGGAAEEILYRGYAVERIRALTGSLWLAGAIPVILFASAHLPMWGRGPALTTLISGAIFTRFYLWQRDLTACIFAHVITDFTGILISPPVSPHI